MSLKHYRNQSKQLLKALQAGSPEAAERVSRNLPRLSGRSVPEVLAAGASLQEMQHVVANEHGYGSWADLPDVNGAGFEDLVKLSDAEIESLLRVVEQRDLIVALKQIDEGVVTKRHQACLGLLQHVTERVRTYMLDEVQYVEVSQPEIEQAAERILAQAERLGKEGSISWPPGTPRNAAPAPKPAPVPPAELQLMSIPLDNLSPEQVRQICHGLATMAEAHGIISLEATLEGCASDMLSEGVRLAVDGTEPALILDLVETRAQTRVRYLETRQRMIIEGLAAIACLDNPRIVQHKVSTMYVVEPEEAYREPQGTLELALQRLQGQPVSKMTLHELTEFLCDVSWIARRAVAVKSQGLADLKELADAVDDKLLAAGLGKLALMPRLSPEHRDRVDAMVAELKEQMGEALAAARVRYQLVADGLAAIQEGKSGEALDEALIAAEHS